MANLLLTAGYATLRRTANGLSLFDLLKREVQTAESPHNPLHTVASNLAKGAKSRTIRISRATIESMALYRELTRADAVGRSRLPSFSVGLHLAPIRIASLPDREICG
jgi:hypothetical protein